MDKIKKLDELGIKNGDIILVHSSISKISRIFCPSNPKNFCDIFFDYLSQKVGPRGTLIFPTFYFSFCKGKPFSIKETKSEMGALTNYALSVPEAKRTKHPIYSFAVIGKYSKKFLEIKNISAFSEKSVFGEVKRLNGKIMIIDLSYNKSMTFFHYIEETQGVSYRFKKYFSGTYINEKGIASEKIYSMMVRDLDKKVITDVEPMGNLFEENGFVKKVSFNNGSFIKILNASELFDFTVKNMKKNPFLLYKIGK